MNHHDDDEQALVPDVARRSFIVGAAVGAATSVGLSGEAAARELHPMAATTSRDSRNRQAGGHGAFLNDDDYATIVAFTERLMPGAPGKPGASEADVANYIDLALSGAYIDLQDVYRRGLAALDAYCNLTHKESFVYLKADIQDQVIVAMEAGKASAFTWPSAKGFFDTLRTHTMEGMFADPVYGGNKDFAGWRLAGFPGAQATFSADDMSSDKAFTRAPIMGIQQRVKSPTRRT